MSDPTPGLDSAQTDFLYWHAVSKMRMGDFDGAGVLFRLLHSASEARTDVALGHLYCLLRVSDYGTAAALIAELRLKRLPADEMALLGRLQRRCEFERTRAASRLKMRAQLGTDLAEPIVMPHTLGDDEMARRSAERRSR